MESEWYFIAENFMVEMEAKEVREQHLYNKPILDVSTQISLISIHDKQTMTLETMKLKDYKLSDRYFLRNGEKFNEDQFQTILKFE